MPVPLHSGEKVLRGIPVSPGVCRGKLRVLRKTDTVVPRREISEAEVPAEIERLQRALLETRRQVLDVQRQVREVMDAEKGSIFDAHLLALEDRVLVDEVIRQIQQDRTSAEYTYQVVAGKYITALAGVEDEYLRERVSDMRDVTARVLNNLQGRSHGMDLRHLDEPCIIISHDLTPSDTAQMDRTKVLGFGTDVGSKTSHTAILARSLRLPAVVGLHTASQELATDDYVLLDGFNGLIIVNPTDQTLFEYGQLIRKQVSLEKKLRDILDQPAVTLDGQRVGLLANIEQATDAENVKDSRAEGVGLFRTEYLFINRGQPPSEDEQYQSYHAAAAALAPHPVTIRTLDLGGDKFLSHLAVPTEMNPFLGWRAIRFCLQQQDIFAAQLRAILRASAQGNVKMMYPMISGLDELNQANDLLAACKAELRAKGQAFDESLEIGVMIEIPSSAMIADALARRVKFFSIGTNDLIQYTLAVDRMNERIAHLYDPTHPAILRLVHTTVSAAHQHGVRVSVCGEMAGDPALVPLLLGLGVDDLSAAPSLLPAIKYLVRRLKFSEAQQLATFALNCENSAEILAHSEALARRSAPSLFKSRI
ncbi:MAG: phosphoenolpyruvate--protein phosphotransferase [Verrucomicrobia bacterium]|jgi:phosphotransferase system enzyme I (PtsI)|nr:phosphoenolpyruvate--protein phosphotransferase [Verrucomicrobiota bacterium]